MKEYIDFNLNDYVQVKLNDEGHEIIKKQWDELRELYPNLSGEYKRKEVDKDGYSRFQMHTLMFVFGPCCFAGAIVVFNTNVKVQVEAKEVRLIRDMCEYLDDNKYSSIGSTSNYHTMMKNLIEEKS